MRQTYLVVLLLIFLLSGAASALNPVNVAVTSSSGWVVANQTDSAVITVTVTDGTGKAIGSADVTLAVSSPWSLKKTNGKTGGSGALETEFLPTTKSGTAVITASVTVAGVTTVPVVQTYTQNIIADTPAEGKKSYSTAVTVGSLTEISVLVTDKHGNPVDSRKKKNEVRFTTTRSGDNAFLDGMNKKVKELQVPLGEEGLAEADFLVSTKPGNNYVAIQPPAPLPTTLITIEGIADGKPASITQMVTPDGNPPTLTTDGKSRFIIEYQVSDQYGNPSTYHDLSITSNAGEKQVISSNNEGKVTVTYGPKALAGQYTLTATALDNPPITATQILRFASDDPTDMLITASPQSMASLDVNKDMVSRVMAKVIDTVGNPVQGQTVSFSIQSVNAGTFVQTTNPVIESGKSRTSTPGTEIAVVSDENGNAAVDFYPGAFTSDPKVTGYSANAEGTAKVRARWSGVTRELDLSYKNYPYLSVSTSVNPMTVDTGEEVEVSIRLRGDGYALLPKPVDVLMLNDRSGSMLSDYPDRMVVEMNAANLFSTKFDYKDDRLGLVSFGTKGKAQASGNADCGRDGNSGDDAAYAKSNYKSDGKTYGDWAVLDLGLSSKSTAISSAISGLVPSGYTPMRYALYKAITEMKKTGRSDAIKALVVMSDGDYNYYGDPLARGSPGSSDPTTYDELDPDFVPFSGLASQSMDEYAKANKIRIYTIGYAAGISNGGRDTLQQLASATNGKYFYALTGDDLADVYTQIAGDLKEAAGVNTQMALDFKKVEVNGALVDGYNVFEYVYRLDESTYLVPPLPRTAWTEDSEAAWNRDQSLNFNLGTIKVNEEWVVNFTLKVIKSGNIKVLGSSSSVTFDEGKGTLKIPDTYLTAIPEGKDKGLEGLKLEIRNLRRTNPDTEKKSAFLVWDITYTGRDPKVREEIQIAPLNSEAYSYRGTTFAAGTDTSGQYILDISNLRPGIYKARVTGFSTDTGSSWSDTRFTVPDVETRPEIQIR